MIHHVVFPDGQGETKPISVAMARKQKIYA